MAGPHRRQFGVEIEFGLISPAARDDYYSNDHDSAYEVVNDLCRQYGGWEWSEDGTWFEFHSPILCGPSGFRELRSMMDSIRNAGGYVTSSDGLHVHHDAPEFVDDPKRCLAVVESWRANQHAIHEMVAPRRRTSGACPPWRDGHINTLQEWVGRVEQQIARDGPPQREYGEIDLPYLYVGRNDLNLSSLAEHGTLEIRLHEGTLDPDVAIAWIKFGQRFIHEVVRSTTPMERAGDGDLLMNRIRLSQEAQRVLKAKQASAYNTPKTKFRPRY